MKFKIFGNLLRLILNRKEVRALSRGQQIEDNVQFGSKPDESIKYTIQPSNCEAVEASYSIDEVRIFVPRQISDNWEHSDLNQIQNAAAPSGQWRIRVEKGRCCIQQNDARLSTSKHSPAKMRIVR